jgi:hypothetical protein
MRSPRRWVGARQAPADGPSGQQGGKGAAGGVSCAPQVQPRALPEPGAWSCSPLMGAADVSTMLPLLPPLLPLLLLLPQVTMVPPSRLMAIVGQAVKWCVPAPLPAPAGRHARSLHVAPAWRGTVVSWACGAAAWGLAQRSSPLNSNFLSVVTDTLLAGVSMCVCASTCVLACAGSRARACCRQARRLTCSGALPRPRATRWRRTPRRWLARWCLAPRHTQRCGALGARRVCTRARGAKPRKAALDSAARQQPRAVCPAPCPHYRQHGWRLRGQRPTACLCVSPATPRAGGCVLPRRHHARHWQHRRLHRGGVSPHGNADLPAASGAVATPAPACVQQPASPCLRRRPVTAPL